MNQTTPRGFDRAVTICDECGLEINGVNAYCVKCSNESVFVYYFYNDEEKDNSQDVGAEQ